MHKLFYASGFLYHSPTEQILLRQMSSLKNSIADMAHGWWHSFKGRRTSQNI